ncbi:hypothetical protein BOTBODRAFT_44320 [Botryobasidium botryosum FD-172 SS1]|uniref:Uncharacterized protein n=1 Tax=Botryobasidium botryosum (strain FD-172 SS1) TaxID=930990 RepID=A0A067MTC7_BOTB1|nr:hypothetical protein BOTBODRAFT_44320 [Botryobasidium botryosum FD-172 SS1]
MSMASSSDLQTESFLAPGKNGADRLRSNFPKAVIKSRVHHATEGTTLPDLPSETADRGMGPLALVGSAACASQQITKDLGIRGREGGTRRWVAAARAGVEGANLCKKGNGVGFLVSGVGDGVGPLNPGPSGRGSATGRRADGSRRRELDESGDGLFVCGVVEAMMVAEKAGESKNPLVQGLYTRLV